jgi:hypothetical protein
MAKEREKSYREEQAYLNHIRKMSKKNIHSCVSPSVDRQLKT